MKIALITTLAGLEENKRIKKEVQSLGYGFELVDLKSFGFKVRNQKVSVDGFNNFKADIAIVRGIFSSIKAISVLVRSLQKKGIAVFDNNFLKHRYSIDKVMDLMKMSYANIPIPDMAYTRDFEKYKSNAKNIGYPVIVKSTRMGKGASVFKVENEGELNKLVSEIVADGKEAKSYIVQEYIPYKYDLRSLVIGEDVFTMQRIPAKGEFRANFSLGGSVEVFNLDKKGKSLALRALSSIDMSVGGVDTLITKDNKRYILEVNHTAGFVGMEKATGVNIGKLYVEHAIKNAK